jgi:hypothetical protein
MPADSKRFQKNISEAAFGSERQFQNGNFDVLAAEP